MRPGIISFIYRERLIMLAIRLKRCYYKYPARLIKPFMPVTVNKEIYKPYIGDRDPLRGSTTL